MTSLNASMEMVNSENKLVSLFSSKESSQITGNRQGCRQRVLGGAEAPPGAPIWSHYYSTELTGKSSKLSLLTYSDF